MDYYIMFEKQSVELSVVGYVDSHYVCDLDRRRLIMGYAFTLAGGPIWRSMV